MTYKIVYFNCHICRHRMAVVDMGHVGSGERYQLMAAGWVNDWLHVEACPVCQHRPADYMLFDIMQNDSRVNKGSSEIPF